MTRFLLFHQLTDTTDVPPAAGAGGDGEPAEPEGRFQKRINELTTKIANRDQHIEALTQRLEALEHGEPTPARMRASSTSGRWRNSVRRMLPDCAVPATAKGFWVTPLLRRPSPLEISEVTLYRCGTTHYRCRQPGCAFLV